MHAATLGHCGNQDVGAGHNRGRPECHHFVAGKGSFGENREMKVNGYTENGKRLSCAALGLRKNFVVTVILLDGKKIRRRLRAQAGAFLNDKAIDAALKMESDALEKYFAGREFRLVQLRDGNFNFVEFTSSDPAKLQKRLEQELRHVEALKEVGAAAEAVIDHSPDAG
jgi:hypothetical protein